jgi:large subunit ribosomal protein L28
VRALIKNSIFMGRFCELTGKGPMKGSIIWRSGKAKKLGGIGTHVTAITKRRFMPNLQRVKAQLPSGEVRYIRVSANALKQGLVTKAPKRTWKKEAAAAAKS